MDQENYEQRESRRMRRAVMYGREQVVLHRGWTIVTLFDKVDSDWSYVIKVGVFDHEQMASPASGEPIVDCDYLNREAALAGAKKMIDEQITQKEGGN